MKRFYFSSHRDNQPQPRLYSRALPGVDNHEIHNHFFHNRDNTSAN
jgi:hypothetical protein